MMMMMVVMVVVVSAFNPTLTLDSTQSTPRHTRIMPTVLTRVKYKTKKLWL